MRAIEKPPQLTQQSKLVLEAISSPERFQIMAALKQQKQGLSFTELSKLFRANHNTLDRHLKLLTRSTLVWNFFERRKGRDHSYYKLSTLGEKLLADLKQEIILST